jgi:hypothetical protein
MENRQRPLFAPDSTLVVSHFEFEGSISVMPAQAGIQESQAEAVG